MVSEIGRGCVDRSQFLVRRFLKKATDLHDTLTKICHFSVFSVPRLWRRGWGARADDSGPRDPSDDLLGIRG